mgnify:FL=1
MFAYPIAKPKFSCIVIFFSIVNFFTWYYNNGYLLLIYFLREQLWQMIILSEHFVLGCNFVLQFQLVCTSLVYIIMVTNFLSTIFLTKQYCWQQQNNIGLLCLLYVYFVSNRYTISNSLTTRSWEHITPTTPYISFIFYVRHFISISSVVYIHMICIWFCLMCLGVPC